MKTRRTKSYACPFLKSFDLLLARRMLADVPKLVQSTSGTNYYATSQSKQCTTRVSLAIWLIHRVSELLITEARWLQSSGARMSCN